MKLGRPSPALVISCIALIAACAGTAYAKTLITSSSQIKNGVVASQDIKNGTVQNIDIKDGTITTKKLKSGKANTGSAAAVGAQTAYHVTRRAGPEAQPANQVVKVASLTVPAGAYVVSAQTVMTALVEPQNVVEGLFMDPIAVGGRCKLSAAGDEAQSLQNVVINKRQAPATLAMQTTRTIGAPAEFFLECSAGVAWRLSETSIIATKVSDIVLTQLPQ